MTVAELWPYGALFVGGGEVSWEAGDGVRKTCFWEGTWEDGGGVVTLEDRPGPGDASFDIFCC